MTDHLFDNFVREKLADHSSPVPGGLWDKIEAATAEKSRKKGLARIPAAYRVAALLILCAGASALLFWPKQPDDKSRTSIIHPGTQPPSTTPPVSADSSAVWQQAPTAGNNTTGQSPTASDNATAPLNNGSKAPAQTNDGNAAPAQASSSGHEAANETIAKSDATTTTPSGFNKTGLSGTNLYKRQQTNTIEDLAGRQQAGRNTYQRHNTLNRGASSAEFNRGNSSHEGANEPTEASAAFSLLPAEMISLKTLSAGSTGSLRQLLDSKGNMMPVIRCPVVRNHIPTDLYLEVYGSAVAPFKQTSANYGRASYLASKDSSQQLRTSFSAGIRLSKGVSENVFVKAGVEYTQINEHFNYRQENERKQVTVITEHTINRPQGDTVLRDTSTYEQIGYLQKRVHNRYKNIDIPILFSYEWGNSQWRLAANAGVIVNLHSWYTGEMLDTSFQTVSVKNVSNGVYKNNIGLGLYAGFSFIKPISERMDLFAEPYFRYNLSNMTKPGQSFNQRLHTAGLSLGFRYRLNGGQQF